MQRIDFRISPLELRSAGMGLVHGLDDLMKGIENGYKEGTTGPDALPVAF